MPGIIELLEFLYSQNYKMDIVISKGRILTEEVLKKFHIRHYFAVIICKEDVKYPKPHFEGIIKGLRTPKICNTKYTYYVGDDVKDAQTATSAPAQFIGIPYATSKGQFILGGYKTYNNFQKLLIFLKKICIIDDLIRKYRGFYSFSDRENLLIDTEDVCTNTINLIELASKDLNKAYRKLIEINVFHF